MTVLIAVVGLVAGRLLAFAVERQLGQGLPTSATRGWLPLVASLRTRDWLSLAVELTTATVATLLFVRYGLSVRGGLLFAASLVLINAGAVDFATRMIDTLVLTVATIAAVGLAPLNGIGWAAAGLGVAAAAGFFGLVYLLAAVLFRGVHAPFGLGDVYLGAFIGAVVGWRALPAALLYGMLLAGAVAAAILLLRALGRPTPRYIAYGMYLCLGALVFLATGTF